MYVINLEKKSMHAHERQIIVIASIHQPSTSTYTLFDKLYLLSMGKLCFGGSISDTPAHFESLGFQMPTHVNPAEFLLDQINVDFADDRTEALERLANIHNAWTKSHLNPGSSQEQLVDAEKAVAVKVPEASGKSQLLIPIFLLHRNFIKSYRDVFVYGIRIAMYLGVFHTPRSKHN